jgi:predicted permease
VLTLGLTIGAVSTLFSLAHTFLMRPLPVPDGHRIVTVEATWDHGTNTGPISYPNYVHLRNAADSFTELAAIYPTAPLFVTRSGEGRQVNGAVVSENFFRMMRLEPFRGRFFTPSEDQVPGRDRVVVIGHDFWRVWFGGDEAAVGSTLRVNGVGFTVVGIAPPGFIGVDAAPLNVIMPTMMLPVGYRWCDDALAVDCTILRMYGRLADGVSLADAAAEMPTLLPAAWRDAEPGYDSGLRVTAARGAHLSSVDLGFLNLLAVVGVVLLLACCANLAGLLLARGRARGHELAIRVSIGAGHGRLVRQLMIESLVLAFSGGILGLMLSVAMTGALNRFFYSMDSSGRPLVYSFGMSPGVVGGVLLVSVLGGVLFGTIPALVTARRGANAALARGSRSVTGNERGLGWLIGAQAAMAVALVVVAGLLNAGARELVSGRGFDPDHVALLRLRPRLLGYTADQTEPYLREVIERLDALPDVRSTTMVGTGISVLGFATEVETRDAEPMTLRTGYIEIGPRYFETLGIRVVRGREFAAADDTNAAPVAIVSEAAVSVLWPGGDPIGKILRFRELDHSVVGVVADVLLPNRASSIRPYVYAPFWQNPHHIDARLQVRVAGDPIQALALLSDTIHEVDADVPVSEIIPMSWRMAGLFRPQRLSAIAMGYAGILAVFLSALGLYSSLAAAVSRRRRELGVRRAVGASAQTVLWMVVRQGTLIVVGGVAAGILLWPQRRLVRSVTCCTRPRVATTCSILSPRWWCCAAVWVHRGSRRAEPRGFRRTSRCGLSRSEARSS